MATVADAESFSNPTTTDDYFCSWVHYHLLKPMPKAIADNQRIAIVSLAVKVPLSAIDAKIIVVAVVPS
jgi:hypothetical protein